MTVKAVVVSLFKDIAPASLLSFAKGIRFKFHAVRVRRFARRACSLESLVAFICNSRQNPLFLANQRENEVLAFLKFLKKLDAMTVVEIGSAQGGNLFLLAQCVSENALLVSVDRNPSSERLDALRGLFRSTQQVEFISGDSHDPTSKERVIDVLKGRPVDLLFIDGDHSYAGVKADFALYAPLVKSGGLVAFHDIVPDHRTRFRVDSGLYAGEVYRFWAELKTEYSRVEEFVDSPDQDGFGIGVLRWQ